MTQKIKILHLEDSPTDAGLVARALKKENVNAEIFVVATKETFKKALEDFSYDIILADHSMGSFDSHEALRLLKQAGITVPFIVITATMTDEFAANVMKEGAADYIIKDRLNRLPSAIINAIAKHHDQAEKLATMKRMEFYIENTPLGFIEWDSQLRVKSWSKRAEEIFGWSEVECISRRESLYNYVLQEDVEKVKTLINGLINGIVERATIQNWNVAKNGKIICCEWFYSILRDKHGKIVSIMSQVQDITWQKKTEEKIIKTNRLYAFIKQVNQNIVRVQDEATLFRNSCSLAIEYGKFKMAWVGMFDEANEKIILIDHKGIPPEEAVLFKNVPYQENGPQDFVLRTGNYYVCNDIEHDPDLVNWRPFAAKHNIHSCIVLPIKKFGNIIGTFNLYSTEKKFSDNEEITLLVEVTNDISFALENFEKAKIHKETEDIVVKNEKRFRALIEKSTDMKTLSSADGKILYASPSIEHLLGYSLPEILSKYPHSLIHPEDIDRYLKNRSDIINLPGKSFNFQHRKRHKNGTWIWCEGSVTNMLNEPGVNALVSNFKDISERKEAERQLAFNDNNLNALINNTKDLMWSVDTNFKLITYNQPFFDIIKLLSTKEIATGDDVFSVSLSPGQADRFKTTYMRAFAGEAFTEMEHITTPVEYWSEISYNPIRRGEEVIGTACHSRDVTNIKKAEHRIQESEAFNRGVLDALNAHIAVINASGVIIAVNETWGRFALDNGEETLRSTGIGSNYFSVCAKAIKAGVKTAAQVVNGMKEILEGDKTSFYIEYPCDSPVEKRWFGMRVVKFESDEPMLVVTHTNVTERKQAELEAIESEVRLAQAQKVAKIGSWETDLRTMKIIWSAETFRIFDVEPHKFPSTHQAFLDLIHPDDCLKTDEAFKAALHSHAINVTEHRIVTTKGVVKMVQETWIIVYDEDEKPLRAIGTCQDITERHLAEEKIKSSQAKLLLAQSIAHLGSWELNFETNALALSEEGNRIFGFPPGRIELSAEAWMAMIHPEDISGILEKIEKAKETSTETTYDHRIVLADGTIKYIHSESQFEVDENGNITGMNGTLQDVTEQKMAELELMNTTASLQQAVNDLSQIMASSLDIICTINAEGKFVEVSAASERILGYKPRELHNRLFMDFVFAEDLEKTANVAGTIMQGTVVTMFENRYMHKNGILVPIIWSAAWNESDKLMYCIAKDGTEKKRLEKELESERERFQDLFVEAPSSIGVLKGPTHVYESANPLYLKLIGKTGIIGKTVKEVLPEVESQGFIDILDGVYETGVNFSANEMLLKIDYHGTLVEMYLNFMYQAFKNAEGIIEGIFFFANDVTEQVLSRKKIEESEARLKEAQAVGRIGSWEVDLLHNIHSWSEEFYNILRTTPEQTPPSREGFLSLLHPEDIERVSKGMLKTLENLAGSFSARVKPGGSGEKHVCSEWKIEMDENNKPIRLYGILQDITERKLAELERVKITDDLIHRNKDLEQFAYIISHNLRAPVAGIMGATSMVNDPGLSVEEKDMLNEGIHESVTKLDEVINDLNLILQVKNHINETKEKVLFSNLVFDIKKSIQGLIDKNNIEVQTDFKEVNEFFTLKTYLYSIFYNLIFNSIKYRQPDIPCVIKIKSQLVENKMELTFSDNGMGIDLKKRGGQVFGLYKRFHSNIEGRGMGLYMVKTQVETLGGKISITSKVNHGTEFKIKF